MQDQGSRNWFEFDEEGRRGRRRRRRRRRGYGKRRRRSRATHRCHRLVGIWPLRSEVSIEGGRGREKNEAQVLYLIKDLIKEVERDIKERDIHQKEDLKEIVLIVELLDIQQSSAESLRDTAREEKEKELMHWMKHKRLT